MLSYLKQNVSCDGQHDMMQISDDEPVNSLAAALLNTDVPVRQMAVVQEFVAQNANIQAALQSTDPSTAPLQRLNSTTTAHIDNTVDSAESIRSVGRICHSLQRESLSQEAVDVINTEGRTLVTGLLNIYSRTMNEIQQNTRVLQAEIAGNERTRDDPITSQLIQQQLQLTSNVPFDPRPAYQAIRQAVAINEQLQDQIKTVEPNENACVRLAAERHAQQLKHAAFILFIGAAVVTMCATIPYLAPIVTSALNVVATAAAAGSEVATVSVPVQAGFGIVSRYIPTLFSFSIRNLRC